MVHIQAANVGSWNLVRGRLLEGKASIGRTWSYEIE